MGDIEVIRLLFALVSAKKKRKQMRSQIYRFLFADRLIRLLYYLPMERMEINLSIMTKDQLKKFIVELEEENKKLKKENRYRAGIVDILPKGKGHIAEETIQDLQKEIKKLKEELSKYKKQYEHSMGEDDELIYEEGLYD